MDERNKKLALIGLERMINESCKSYEDMFEIDDECNSNYDSIVRRINQLTSEYIELKNA